MPACVVNPHGWTNIKLKENSDVDFLLTWERSTSRVKPFSSAGNPSGIVKGF